MAGENTETLANLSREERRFAPPADLAANANVTAAAYDEANADRLAFWDKQAQRLTWAQPWSQVLDWSDAPFAKWYVGGKLNAAYNCVDRHVEAGRGDKVAIHWVGEPIDDARDITYAQLQDEVCKAANAITELGVGKGDRVAIYLPMIPEAVIAMLACARIGAIHTVVFGGFSAEALSARIADCEAKLVITADGGYRRGEPFALKPTVDEAVAKVATTNPGLAEKVLVVRRTGQETATSDLDVWWHDVVDSASTSHTAEAHDSEHPLYVMYTSGTTGKPKGVRLLHSAWTYEGAAIESQDILDETDLQFLWLPMAHVFGKVLLSAQLACGFATAIDGRVDKIIDNLAIVRPTFMGAAPRIFEKAYARVVTTTAQDGGAKEKIFNKAFEVGRKVVHLKAAGKPIPLMLGLQYKLFDKLVFSKVRERFGGRARFFISGSAALNRDIAEWFDAAGVVILEGYGLTETAAGAFVNHPDDNRIGTVGVAFPGSEAKLGENDEILIRGPHVMAGYHNRPDATAEALDADGWFHTGDKGSISEDGFLTITGRIKELFKTSGGKYVAPPALEAKFKALCPYASQFMVFGNLRNYCVALVTLDADSLADWSKEIGMEGASYAEAAGSEAAHKMIEGYIEQLNSQVNRWETIKKFKILDHDLTIDTGELTPSLKVKRNVIETNYSEILDGFYQ